MMFYTFCSFSHLPGGLVNFASFEKVSHTTTNEDDGQKASEKNFPEAKKDSKYYQGSLALDL